ncbi:MAG TPA: hypothetical protein PLN03_13720 [Spirochaetota bacterium]|nr:hypothetical protein [Spirochaetota bacterium]
MKKIFILLFITLFMMELPSQESHHKWQRFSGKWVVENSRAMEVNGWASPWDYYELIEYNSIVSLQDFKDYSEISISANITERINSLAELLISFAITSESASWFYRMYGFKLSGGFWGINKVSFIFTDKNDKSKPNATKNNRLVQELASNTCKVKYGRDYNFKILFENGNVALYINGEKVLCAPFTEKTNYGRIAISSRNAKVAIDNVEVKKGQDLIFLDDFNEDSIYVRVVKATREVNRAD